MKKGFLRLSLASVFVLSVFFHPGCERPQKEAVSAAVGLGAPDFSLRDADGRLWRLSDLKGSVVLVNFWASWCPPCKEEMPYLQNLYEKMKGNPKFSLLTVLYRDDPKAAYAYLRENGYTFPMLMDPESTAARSYGLTGVPETFLIDKAGVVQAKKIGPAKWDAPEFVEELNRMAAM